LRDIPNELKFCAGVAAGCALLRARPERPRRRAAEETDEVAPSHRVPFHSITSSARAISDCGPTTRKVGGKNAVNPQPIPPGAAN
jgi:hypothetical protein